MKLFDSKFNFTGLILSVLLSASMAEIDAMCLATGWGVVAVLFLGAVIMDTDPDSIF